MSRNNLRNAQAQKAGEFYTLYEDIQNEMNVLCEFNPNLFRDKVVLLPCDDPEWSNFTKFFAQNFEVFGLKKLISTSYATNSKKFKVPVQMSIFDSDDAKYDPTKDDVCGKIMTLTRDTNKSGGIDIDDLEWDYLEGDGDFRSEEVAKLRDEADFIITNPPFALFREFITWIMEANKKFIVIGPQNAIAYQEIFPLIQANKIWLGQPFKGNVGFFRSPYEDIAASGDHREGLIRVSGVMWFTNVDLARRHDRTKPMTMEDNLRYSSHEEIRQKGYRRYDNYDAIEVPFSDAIPSDYEGVMGVPLTFMDKYNPDVYEIVGIAKTPMGSGLRTKIYDRQTQFDIKDGVETQNNVTKLNDGPAILLGTNKPTAEDDYPFYCVDGQYYESIYVRILIRRKK